MAITQADYDFETSLESGFKAALENEAGLSGILTSSTIGEMPDEAIAIEAIIEGLASDHLSSEGEFNHYNSKLIVRIQTPRIKSDATSSVTTHNNLKSLVRLALGLNLSANLAAGFAANSLTIERCLPAQTRREQDEFYLSSEIEFDVQFSLD